MDDLIILLPLLCIVFALAFFKGELKRVSIFFILVITSFRLLFLLQSLIDESVWFGVGVVAIILMFILPLVGIILLLVKRKSTRSFQECC